jgi:hypothetical protein
LWKHDLKRDRLTVSVEKFGPISSPVVERIREEAQDLARFLGAAEAEVRVE